MHGPARAKNTSDRRDDDTSPPEIGDQDLKSAQDLLPTSGESVDDVVSKDDVPQPDVVNQSSARFFGAQMHATDVEIRSR